MRVSLPVFNHILSDNIYRDPIYPDPRVFWTRIELQLRVYKILSEGHIYGLYIYERFSACVNHLIAIRTAN